MAASSSDPGGLFARFPQVLGLVPGLFASQSRKTQSVPTATLLLGTQQYKGVDYDFEGKSPLGVHDLRVLQGVCMLASRPENELEMEMASPKSAVTASLATALACQMTAPGKAGLAKIVTGSAYGLATAGGYSSTAGGGRKNITPSLDRLAAITVICRQDGAETARSQLLAWTKLNSAQAGLGERTDTLVIAITPLLSAPLLKGGQGDFTYLLQSEIDAFGEAKNSACARVLHLRLNALIKHGQSKKFFAATLAEYAFGPTTSKDTRRRQFQNVRDALALMPQLGWSIEADERVGKKKLYTIGRPALSPKSKVPK